jgi:hypothetical protein
MSSGIYLHPLYEWVIDFLPEAIPDSKPMLDQFEKIQADVGVHVDRDILQSFTGEVASVSFPPAVPSLMGGGDSVLYLKCAKPERIQELLHMGFELLQQNPGLQAQQIKLNKVENLEGFEELSAMSLAMFGAKPVIGFRDGWMVIGSSANAVQKSLDTKAGKGKTFAESDTFKKFNLDASGTVSAISYTNTAQGIREAAQAINMVGTMAPNFLAMAGQGQDNPDLKIVQDLLGLLPSVAQIVAKFDFLESTMSVTKAGDAPNSYISHSVTLVRAPAAN